MTFKLPSLLYKSARVQQEIDAEQQHERPDWLRVMRLKALRLKIMDRLHLLARETMAFGQRDGGPLPAC